MKKILYSILQTSGTRIYSVLLSIIALSLTTRWLGTEGRGIVVSIATWLDLFIEIGSLSFGTVFIYQATKKREPHWLLQKVALLNIHIAVVTSIAAIFITLSYVGSAYWGWSDLFNSIPLYALLIGLLITLPFGLWELYSGSLLNIEDKLSSYNRYQIIGSTTNSFVIILFIVIIPLGIYGAILAKLAWKMVVSIGSLKVLLKPKITPLVYSMNEYSLLVKEGFKVHLNTIGVLMTTMIDILMVNAYLGHEQTAFYQLAVQLNQMMLIVPIAVMTVLQGEVTRKSYLDIWRYQTKLLILTLGFIFITGMIAALTAQWWLIWLAGEAFAPAIELFQYLLIFTFVATFTTILSVQWVARGWFTAISIITLIKGTINISLNALLIPKYGVKGAIWATYGVISFSILVNIAMILYCELDWRKNGKMVDKS
ncbi:MAG: lipopolysaccharide biosynthesis protein [Thiotrichaceae bacterium]|nr:lipopolysaccharide biosynthesis protein [Thiotrichaceae bacterium]